jgi:cell division protein FtsB
VEVVGVAARKRTPARKKRARRARPRVRLGILLPVMAVALIGFLTYRPLSTYLETRDALEARRAEVATLTAQKADIEARVARSTSLDALAREARRIGRVRPGEQLFIIKGIEAWRRANAQR